MFKLFVIFILNWFLCCSVADNNYSGSTGIIYSPNYPLNYENNANIVYTISVSPGYYIHLTFLDFLTEDSYDFLTVIDYLNDDIDQSTANRLTGSQSGLTVSLMNSKAKLIFKSDLTNTFRGFAIQFDSVPIGSSYSPSSTTCSSPLHLSSFGIITSPSFPLNYPNNFSCSYILLAPKDHRITLQFVAFNTEDGYDIVYIYDGNNNSFPLFGKFSGKKIPPKITSTSNALYIFFTTDLVNNYQGFSALYTSTLVGNVDNKIEVQKKFQFLNKTLNQA